MVKRTYLLPKSITSFPSERSETERSPSFWLEQKHVAGGAAAVFGVDDDDGVDDDVGGGGGGGPDGGDDVVGGGGPDGQFPGSV